MKKPLLILLTLLISLFVTAQQEKCNFYCHNGKVVKQLNDNSVGGHETHDDQFLGTCDDFTGEVGDSCGTLSVKKFDYTKPVPIGLRYYIYDVYGRIYQMGITDDNFVNNLPKGGFLFVKLEGYKANKIIKQ